MAAFRADELAELCLRAQLAGPQALARDFVDDDRRWGVDSGAPASVDLQGQDELPPVVSISVKLATLASEQVGAIGSLLTGTTAGWIGLASIGRSVVEGCSAVAWLLDDKVSSGVRHRRAWLLWAVAEGNAELTAIADAGRTGAMSGSPRRLADIEKMIRDRIGVDLERSARAKPKDWRLDGVSLPGPQAMVAHAVDRWFPGADGRTLYSQVSREAHSDVLLALALVDDTLTISTREGLDFVPTVLAFWGLTWNHVLSYLGAASQDYDAWLRRMLRAIGRSDLVTP